MKSENFSNIGIDASNITVGGGLTHLVEMLNAATPSNYGFKKVIVWASQSTLDQINDHPWLMKCPHDALEKNIFQRALWQRNSLEYYAKKENCDLLFIPGGTFFTNFHPIVTMNQNLLPFEWEEIKRYGFSLFTIKWLSLRFSQATSYKNANGVIFLSEYAKNTVLEVTGTLNGKYKVIPHGMNSRFFIHPKVQKPISYYSIDNPFRIIYMSSLEPYKNNLTAIKAVIALRKEGLPVTLDIYGRGSKNKTNELNCIIKLMDKYKSVKYHGEIPYDSFHEKYKKADLAIYASSCETFGQTLIEGMAAGLPTICANKSTMPELLGNAGIYFDLNNSEDIKNTLKNVIFSPELRVEKSKMAFKKAKNYSWGKCANETFEFLGSFVEKNNQFL
jgi:glycosyltransferase involved in cell wall biosynthesis